MALPPLITTKAELSGVAAEVRAGLLAHRKPTLDDRLVGGACGTILKLAGQPLKHVCDAGDQQLTTVEGRGEWFGLMENRTKSDGALSRPQHGLDRVQSFRSSSRAFQKRVEVADARKLLT
jgi:hypothetical protein